MINLIPLYNPKDVTTVTKLGVVLYTMDSVCDMIKDLLENGSFIEINELRKQLMDWAQVPFDYGYRQFPSHKVSDTKLVTTIELHIATFTLSIDDFMDSYRTNTYLYKAIDFKINGISSPRSIEDDDIPYQLADTVIKKYLITKVGILDVSHKLRYVKINDERRTHNED